MTRRQIGPDDAAPSTGFTPTLSIVDDVKRALKVIPPELPPLKVVYASHSVPWGETYRMWHTDGRMALYVNRGELAESMRGESMRGELSESMRPLRSVEPLGMSAVMGGNPAGLTGVPVIPSR